MGTRIDVAGMLCAVAAAVLYQIMSATAAESTAAPTGDDGLPEVHWATYLSIPFVAGVVGWGTNWVAIKMTFFPVEFIGWDLWRPEGEPIGLFGWQGIIPAKAAKMAAISVDLLTQRLFNVREIFARLDASTFSDEFRPGTEKIMLKLVPEIARDLMPGVWETLPGRMRRALLSKMLDDNKVMVRDLLDEMRENVDEVLDLRTMCIESIVNHKELLNNCFLKCGAKEFPFIVNSGFYFGFLFGLIQMVVYIFYRAGWVLPVFGLVVGYATNWLALWLIFNPIEETLYCCGKVKMQGLFLKRQAEVSAEFARINSSTLLTSEKMWESILTGPRNIQFRYMLNRHSRAFAKKLLGRLRAFLGARLGGDAMARCVEVQCAHCLIVSRSGLLIEAPCAFRDLFFSHATGRRAAGPHRGPHHGGNAVADPLRARLHRGRARHGDGAAREDGRAAVGRVRGRAAPGVPGGRDQADPRRRGARAGRRVLPAVRRVHGVMERDG